MNTIAFCTISSLNYFPVGKTLFDSLKQHHPNADFIYLIVDKKTNVIHIDSVEILFAEELNIPGFIEMAFVYTITELNTAVKPFLLSYLIHRGYKKILFLDPDIYVYNPLQKAIDYLDIYSVVLIPHALKPERAPISFLDKIQWEQNMTFTGIFNLGFIGISNTPLIHEILRWWEDRCRYLCFVEPSEGLFVDQKWSELMIAYWESVGILRDPGYNVSIWNLHERHIEGYCVNKHMPLVFYHFSSFDFNNSDIISKHDPKMKLTLFPELYNLFSSYKEIVLENGYYKYLSLPYSYGYFADGTQIDELERRLYAMVLPYYSSNPFEDTRKIFYKKVRHLSKYVQSKKKNLFTTIVCWGGILIFKILGPAIYRSIVKQLAKSASLRAHTFLLSKT